MIKINITKLAKVIRSKNAGPMKLTLDIIFKDFKVYKKIKTKNIINKKLISNLYKINQDRIISIINYDPAKAIKITLIRPMICGETGETDIYGAQQHAPLLKIEIPEEIIE